MSVSATGQLVRTIRELDSARLGQEARERAKLAILDCLAALLGGVEEDSAVIVRSHLERLGGEPEALVVGGSRRLPAEAAAMANGVAAHAIDYDDMSPPMNGHPSAPLVPVLLALGALQGATGSQVLSAYLAGFEVEARLGRALNPGHYKHGWHATSTLGVLGATGAAARLLRLDASQTAHALGIAASRAGGLLQNFGTMTKPLHVGNAAAAGVAAARLAALGFTADAHILEARQGFFALFGKGDLKPVDFGPEGPIELETSGVALKLYPCCGGQHTSIDATLDLAEEYRFSAGDVAGVEVRITEMASQMLVHHNPSTPLEAKFSAEYGVAAALVDGRVGLAQFDPERVLAPDLRSVLSLVRVIVDPTIEPMGGRFPSDVAVILRDGRQVRRRVDIHRGQPERPLSREQIAGKFRDCSTRHLSEDAQELVIREVMRLDRVESMDTLLSTLGRIKTS